VCVCVCVRERERQREKVRERERACGVYQRASLGVRGREFVCMYE